VKSTKSTSPPNSYATAWWLATLVVAAALYYVALSDTVYNVTSPPGPFQILLRKSYSIAAFALVGWLFARASSASGRPRSALFVAFSVAAYSALIELGQAIGQTHEGLLWNLIDVACGFLGGLLGALVLRLRKIAAARP